MNRCVIRTAPVRKRSAAGRSYGDDAKIARAEARGSAWVDIFARRTAWSTVLLRLLVMLTSVVTGCDANLGVAPNPFRDVPPIELSGEAQTVEGNIVPLGELSIGQGLRITVDGADAVSVLMLIEDAESDQSGIIVGGGPVGEAIDYHTLLPGRYFLFIQFGLDIAETAFSSTITVGLVEDALLPPETQIVHVAFEDRFLSDPGLWDPIDGSEDDRVFLESIEETVQTQILEELRTIFAGTPIVIVDRVEDGAGDPMSRVTFSPERVPAADQDFADAALPAPDPSRPECQERVVFGEVLPSGSIEDVGNRIPNDEAIVYVGSFQGRGETCQTSAVNSLNNVVLTLAQTAAHEIGHLVGLMHVEQVDLMNRSATLAFTRQLDFARGQIQLDRLLDGEVVSEVFPAVVQDPEIYFRAVFSGGMDLQSPGDSE